jgi:hypothetical protein
MAVVNIVTMPEVVALTDRIRADLRAAGHEVRELSAPVEGARPILIAVLSPGAVTPEDVRGKPRPTAEMSPVMQAIMTALDNRQHVIPVVAEAVDLPRVIDHLQPHDFSQGYDAGPLLNRLRDLSGPDAPPPLTALTPRVRAANRRAGIIAAALVSVIFVIAVIAVGSGTVRAPENEFASVETQIILTRNFYIDDALPRTTEQAASFPTTVLDARPSVMPFLIATASAIAGGVEGMFVPRSTLEATHFPLTLVSVSTVVRDRLAATVTAQAAIAPAVSTSTPGAPDPEATSDAEATAE